MVAFVFPFVCCPFTLRICEGVMFYYQDVPSFEITCNSNRYSLAKNFRNHDKIQTNHESQAIFELRNNDMEEKKIEIIIGTNEEYVLGYQLNIAEDGKVSLEQNFADHAHIGSVRQVAVGGRFLVSGGTDEHIKVFDLVKRTEVGTLIEHEGTITHLGFHGNKYLFSAADDGKICIFSKKGWRCEKTLKSHSAGVLGLAVHPSGKLALSISRDQKLRTWNLIKGRKAYITHIDRMADIVQWSPTGANYLLVKRSSVEVFDVASCKVTHSVDFKEKVTTLLFLTDDIIAVAAGDKNICFYDITNQFEILQWEAHNLRVKCLRLIPREHFEEPWLVSASSDGIIKLWKLQLLSLTTKPELLAEVDTTCRIICMAIYMPPGRSKNKKIKYEADPEEEEIQLEENEESETKKKLKIKKNKIKKIKAIIKDEAEPEAEQIKLERNGDSEPKEKMKTKKKRTKKVESPSDSCVSKKKKVKRSV